MKAYWDKFGAMKTKTTLFVLLNLYCLSVFAQSSWTNYTNDRLISDVLVEGDNVWVGSQGGLTRTNLQTGEFQTYLPYNSPIMGGGITEIEKAPDNTLWFISENAGVFQLKNGEWTNYYEELNSTPYHEIKSLQIQTNGDVWFCVDLYNDHSLNKLIRISNGEVKSFGNLPEDVKSFAVLEEQTIFISNGETIHRYDATVEQIVEIYNSENSIIYPEEEFREIILDDKGTLILSSESRILQLKNGTISLLSAVGIEVNKAFKDPLGKIYLQPYHNNPHAIRLITYDGQTVTYLKDQDLQPYPASDDPLFRGADDEGGLYAMIWNLDTEYTLFRFDGNSWAPVKTQIFPLLDNYQEDVQSDCEGNLWFSSRDGVDVRYADGSWEHFAIEVSPFTYFLAWAMTVDPVTCDVWFANNGNSGNPNIPGIIRISNGVVTSFLLGHANVSEIEAAIDGKVYFFSALTGLGYIENDEVHYLDQLDQIDFVFSMDTDSKGNLYVAEWGPTLFKYDGVNLTQFGTGELGDLNYYVYVDNDDFLWVNYSGGGVKQYDGIQWNDYSDFWSENTFNSIVQDKMGNYWVSTWHDGLYYWDKQTLQNYNIFNSDLTTNLLRGVALDPDGNLIVTQQVGASVLSIPKLTATYRGTGTVFFDSAKDGFFDEGDDILVPGQKIMNIDQNKWAVTNTYGKYSFYGESSEVNNYLHELEPDATSTADNPQSAEFVDYHSILPDFGYWKLNIPDVKVTIVNGIPVCNRNFVVHIYLHNKGAYTMTGDLTFHYNELLTFVGSSIPVSDMSDGKLVFENLTVSPFEILIIKLEFTAPGFGEEGMGLIFEGIFGDVENSFVGMTMDSVVCSFDPNDKKVEPTGEFYHDYSLIKDPLKYTIRFQNEGTFKAFDITIVDTLDLHLDPSTFELLASSHNVETSVTMEGIITFIFRNIDLPPRSVDESGSQGYVSFAVCPDSNLVTLERIFNNASIYFDFNPPIKTNTTSWNIVDDLATVSTTEAHAEFSIYPNPTKGILILEIDEKADFYIWDNMGRFIDSGSVQPGNNVIQLDIPSGIYYLQVKNEGAVDINEKVVVIK